MYLKLDMMHIAIMFGILFALAQMYDAMYVYPIAANKANQVCQQKGFDFYEDFSRVGLFSTEPVAVTCKFVDQYQKSDINIKGSVPVSVQ